MQSFEHFVCAARLHGQSMFRGERSHRFYLDTISHEHLLIGTVALIEIAGNICTGNSWQVNFLFLFPSPGPT
ncbi:hypothetical protein EW146_g537 [Bondarzewia mesenterica]|uniref:Uncharacterized protein n=1 Tax=Bondarzewia mesenterica TaxID=1095465 RepID=A0A4S4M6I8_9AGAM|nr:hypothetical protein EW146_g537 [Bondarzewia mesenterica]